MAMLVTDPQVQEDLLARRRKSGGDRFDEVWEGTYVMAPFANDEHQEIQAKLVALFQMLMGWEQQALVRAGVNVSDRDHGWEFNYRCPDVAVFLKGTSAQNRGTHWVGGPDFAVEILSPGDQTSQKIPFYGSVGIRELLVIGRQPWAIELYRLAGSALLSAGCLNPGDGEAMVSQVVPVTFRLLAGARPMIEVSHPRSGRQWLV